MSADEQGTPVSGEGLSEAEREQVALACDAMFDFSDTWIRFLRNGDETVLLPVIERILAAREAAWAERVAAVEGELAELSHAISWDTTCLNCARMLDACYAETRQAESAEAALATALREKAEDRARVEAVRSRIWALGESIYGEEGVEHNEGCEGEPDCLACIVADLRAALAIPTATGDQT